MLEGARGVPIAPRTIPDSRLPTRPGPDVAKELGGRYLLRYLLPHQVGDFRFGSDKRHYATPTPYAPEETVSWLYLPSPAQARCFVMLLDPSRILEIQGPRWVRLGKGIEYVLPKGFKREAIVGGWELEVT